MQYAWVCSAQIFSLFLHLLSCVNSRNLQNISEEITEAAAEKIKKSETPSKKLVKVVSNATQTENLKSTPSPPPEKEEEEEVIVETRETQVSQIYNVAWVESPRSGAWTITEEAEFQKCTLIVMVLEINVFYHANLFCRCLKTKELLQFVNL